MVLLRWQNTLVMWVYTGERRVFFFIEMLEIMASLGRIFEARNTSAIFKFHLEIMHPRIDNGSFGFSGLVRKYRDSVRTVLFVV